MTYENFLQQVNLAEQLTSSDFGVSTGLISQGYWEASKWYFVNVERGSCNLGDGGGGRLRGKPAYICPKPETSPPDVAILVLLPSAELCHPPSSSVGFILFLINSVSCS